MGVVAYPVGRNSTQISGLTPNTTYTFVVQARDEAGHLSPLSEPVTVTTLPPPPSCAVRDSSYLRVRNVRHNALIPPGGTVSLGFVATGAQAPEEVTLNGGVCVVAAE